MKLRSTLLLLAASAVAGAIGLSASQAAAALPWCSQVSYSFNEYFEIFCQGDGAPVYGRGQAVDSNGKLVAANLLAGSQVPGRYGPIARVTGIAANGNY